MPLINANSLPVPESSDVLGAYSDVVKVKDPGLGISAGRVVPGESYEQLVTANFAFVTSAALGNRVVFFVLNDPNAGFMIAQPASAPQGPSVTSNYSVDGNGGQTYGPVGGNYAIGIPPVLLLPGQSFLVLVQGMDAADEIRSVVLLLFRVPSAPAERAPINVTAPALLI